MRATPADEVAIFQQVHELLLQQARRRGDVSDRPALRASREDARQSRRRPYQCSQLLAPLRGDAPAQAEFRMVRCRDLSPGGFAYYANERPPSPQVVIALGLAPFSFFVAQVLRVQAAEPEAGADFLIGCKFLYRLGAAS